MLATFIEDRDLARRGREARDWLTQDERRRVIGLVIASIAISILMSVLVSALVGFVGRRRSASADDLEEELESDVDEMVGVAVMEAVEAVEAVEPTSV